MRGDVAHADTVAVAEHVKAERAVLVQKRKSRGVQPERLSELNAGKRPSACRKRIDTAARRARDGLHPATGIAGKLYRRVERAERLGKCLRRHADPAFIFGRVLLAGAFDRPQIRHVRPQTAAASSVEPPEQEK